MGLELSVAQTLIKIKVALDRREEPFLGYIAKFHKFVPLSEGEVDEMLKHRSINSKKSKNEFKFLMGVNAEGVIFYYPEDCSKLTEVTLCGVVAHELMHTVLRHVVRTPRRLDVNIANIAQDLIVNWHCTQMRFRLPKVVEGTENKGGLVPSEDGLAVFDVMVGDDGSKVTVRIDDIPHKTWLMIYHEIMDQLTQGDGNGGSGKYYVQGRFDHHDFQESPKSSKPGDPGSEQYWKFKIAEAWQYTKQKGTKSGHMMGLIADLMEPKMDWRSILRNLVSSGIGDITSWRKPKRGAICRDIYLPNTYSEEVKVVCAIDTSGSVSDECLRTFVSETVSILKLYPKVELDVLVCDCQLKAYSYTERDLDEIERLPIHGRGGTSHKPVVDWVLEHRPDTRILICFTDGESDIEHEFGRLPDTCRKIFALGESCRTVQERLAKYGEVLIVDKGVE